MDKDYCEIICTAIDEIVTAKLEGLEYDITKLCTITDDTYSYQGKYIVSDGTAKYEAYTTDISLKKGNSVLVTIPKGDYQLQKTILCRISADDTTPFNYTSPMDTMIKITNNIFDNANVVYGENIGLLANDNNRSSAIGPIYSLTESGQFSGFTRLGITADFKSLLNGLDVATGSYGIKALIYTEILTSPGIIENGVYELTFSSADMIGNPYQFDSYFYQEKVFDISNINGIKQIDIYFYQNGQFYDGNNNYVNWEYNDSILDTQKMPNNLFVDNVKIYLGYEMGAFTEETLMIFTNDSLTYHHTNQSLARQIALRWIHKIEDNKFELLNSNNLTDQFEIKWFKYHPGYEIINQYAGKDWEEIPPDPELFSCTVLLDTDKQQEQIKVIGLIHEITGIDEYGNDIITVVPYYSNLLIFENEEDVPDKTTKDAITALSIVCEDGSEGNYFIYNQNGKIINEGEGKGKKRYLKALYKGAEITSSIGKLDYIQWFFPVEKTMLYFSDDYYTENDGEKSDEVIKYKGVDYDLITRKSELIEATQTNELTSTRQAFSIGNQWNYENANNTIRCIVSINGVLHEAIEELRFGKSGTNGTNTTFLIEMVGNENALIINEDVDKNTLLVKARLYDSNGSNVGFTVEQAAEIQWSWLNQSENDYIKLPSKTNGDNILLTCNTNQIPSDNYFILKATYGMLEAYLPIPLKTSKTSHIEGAREIIYNNLGTPSYYSDAYVIYYQKNDTYIEDIDAEWQLSSFETFDKPLTQGYIPKLINLQSQPKYKALSASPFYASGYNDKVCVYYYNPETNCGWSQPILIMQSKYDFAMLNQWDGSLTLNEDNGTILSTMLGAGRKNSNNTFSGVLIGDIQTGTGNSVDTNTLTGVYGLHEGQLSYSLKEDGTASFGKSGRGQILINGDTSIIKNAGYDEDDKGTSIDLDDGIIDIKWPGKNYNINKSFLGRIRLQPKDPYLYINSSDNMTLMQIGDTSSLLQSNNFTANSGAKLDLMNGNFDARSSQGQVIISGQGSPYFKIGIPSNASDISYSNSLFLLDDDNYYLKSSTYNEVTFIKTNDSYKYNTYKQSANSIVNISTYVAVAPNGTVYSTTGSQNNLVVQKEYTFLAITNNDTEDNTSVISQTSDQVKQIYLSQLIPNLKETNNKGSGFKLDLKNNMIHGYDLYLKGTNTALAGNPSFILDSSASENPFRIGSNFSVSWDGILTCNKVNSLNDDGRDNYPISINNNFYVNRGGSVGGSSADFGSGTFGGLSAGGINVPQAIKDLQSDVSVLYENCALFEYQIEKLREDLDKYSYHRHSFKVSASVTGTSHSHDVRWSSFDITCGSSSSGGSVSYSALTGTPSFGQG